MFRGFKQLIISIILCLCFTANAAAAPWITLKLTYDYSQHIYNAESVYIKINGTQLNNLTMPPIIMNGSTLVPAREVMEPLGAVVDWKKDTEEIYIAYENTIAIIKIGSKTANCNGTIKEMAVAPKIINNKTMVPVRFVSEILGFKVDWVDAERTIYISSKDSLGSENDADGIAAPTTSALEQTTQPSADGEQEIPNPFFSSTEATTQATTQITTQAAAQQTTEQTAQATTQGSAAIDTVSLGSLTSEVAFNENFYYDRNMSQLIFSSDFIVGGVSGIKQSSDSNAKKYYFSFKVTDPAGIGNGYYNIDDTNLSRLEVYNKNGDVTLCFTEKANADFKVYDDEGSIYFKAFV